ncbi:hypothetical protein [Pseudomonas phage TC6]|uniref:Uncharacterized protein n=1 Tax=Pseudomonas phage TC6 TaxID=2060947 RepID=A0A2H5BQF6_9CAUD|nr:hypothetical protein [Pseudomonas phage TC6]
MKREHYLIALKARKVFKKILLGKGKVDGHYKLCAAYMASVGAVYKNHAYKDHLQVSTNQVCHFGLKSLPTNSIAVISGLQPKYIGNLLNTKEGEAYLDWLLNRSPYSKVFVTKSAKDAIKNSCIIADSSAPSNLLAAGLVASRRLWEANHILIVWHDLVHAGMNEDLAFWVAHKSQARANRAGNINFLTCHSGHCSMNPHFFDKEALCAWLDHKVTTPNEPYSECVQYNYYDRMYLHKNKQGNGWGMIEPRNNMGQWLDANFKVKAEADKGVNPFQKAKPKEGGGSVSYWKGIEAMAAFEHEIMKEIGRA